MKRSKRAFDVLVGGAALIVLSPVMAVIAVIVRRTLGRPVLFTQQRPGIGHRLFTIYKFRTLTDARDTSGALLPDAQRMTPFGRMLRSTSLDELPELFNVVKGDMSLVGPRPLLVQYLDRYSDDQARRHEVAPGITGPAQTSGRNTLGWDERFALDVWYVDHQTVWLDVRILVRTLLAVVRRHGITEEGHDTMSEFQGPKQP